MPANLVLKGKVGCRAAQLIRRLIDNRRKHAEGPLNERWQVMYFLIIVLFLLLAANISNVVHHVLAKRFHADIVLLLLVQLVRFLVGLLVRRFHVGSVIVAVTIIVVIAISTAGHAEPLG